MEDKHSERPGGDVTLRGKRDGGGGGRELLEDHEGIWIIKRTMPR